MDVLVLQYAWILLVLVGLEGLLAADNAVVMAVMVKHLPKPQQKKPCSTDCRWRFCSAFWLFLRLPCWSTFGRSRHSVRFI